jgi:catechol 2,3-dioxygenase-like lactoylglutathione lyase family enzyme
MSRQPDRRNFGEAGSGPHVAELSRQEDTTVRITLVSIHVEDQERALVFYRDVLGFLPKTDIPMGAYRWLTVVAPDRPDGPELVLEPNAHPAARAYQDALLRDGIPVNSFEVDDVDAEHHRLRGKGVEFTRPPTDAGPVRIALFADTCGNLVQIHARRAPG